MWWKTVSSAACVVLGLQSIGVHATKQKPISASGHGGSTSKNPFTDEFAKLAKDTLDEWHCAGIAISVVDGDDVFAEVGTRQRYAIHIYKLTVFQGYGFATLPDVPATPETLWYVGSTTKAHTAAALAQLIDSKNHSALSRGWRTPISNIIRDDFVLQDAWSTDHITLEDAASHRTGFTRHDGSVAFDANNAQHVVRDTVRNMRNLPLHLEPRVEFHYCNLMFTVLSHVVESTTGKRLGHVLKDLIWSPLGMNSTYMDLQEAKDAPEHLSTGYYWNKEEKKLKAMPFMPTEPLNGAGAMISNVLDYAKWVKSLLRKSGPLSEAVHREIRTPRMVQSPEPAMGADATLYSLAWFRTTIHGQVAYWHSGSVGTHGALVYWFPDLNYGAVIFANYPSPARQVLMWRLIEDKLRIPKDRRYNMGDKLVQPIPPGKRDGVLTGTQDERSRRRGGTRHLERAHHPLPGQTQDAAAAVAAAVRPRGHLPQPGLRIARAQASAAPVEPRGDDPGRGQQQGGVDGPPGASPGLERLLDRVRRRCCRPAGLSRGAVYLGRRWQGGGVGGYAV